MLAIGYRLGYFVIEKFRGTTPGKFMQSKKPKKLDLLLGLLADYEWHWSEELASKVSWRFGATIKDARDEGYPIERDQVGPKHRYRLVRS
jgi:hypothetical protein